jgi:hypothetical protein
MTSNFESQRPRNTVKGHKDHSQNDSGHDLLTSSCRVVPDESAESRPCPNPAIFLAMLDRYRAEPTPRRFDDASFLKIIILDKMRQRLEDVEDEFDTPMGSQQRKIIGLSSLDMTWFVVLCE